MGGLFLVQVKQILLNPVPATPSTALRMAELAIQTGLPKGFSM